jgi:protein-S-isoprenylcysteine O-methyltransferase Ste14
MDRGTILRVWLPMVGGLMVLGWIFLSVPEPYGPTRLIGLVVALIGLAGVILSRYTLGRSFSIAPKATALVTSGIYSRIRNPIYISGMIFLIGVALIVERPKLLAILLVLIPMQILRARREAAVLEGKFGDAYREYRRRTGSPRSRLLSFQQ